ncbi:hypothetical protein KCP76_11530 [Salmonella enterica subsp. enterica serovar Weltevreden]|nr:hypothetical protein KCP76_11530 [Salmonella enterica subsp. enterica serovar Weltevreden]
MTVDRIRLPRAICALLARVAPASVPLSFQQNNHISSPSSQPRAYPEARAGDKRGGLRVYRRRCLLLPAYTLG